jgi:phosphoribosylformylglycinamidine synthase I
MTAKPQALVIRAPGTNCDFETARAFEMAGAEVTVAHVNRLIESASPLAGKQILCIPGGFSYGDDLGAGRIFAQQLRNRLGCALQTFRDAGNCILGICNGFQVLLQTGLLVAGNHGSSAVASLTRNDVGCYQDRWVHLEVANGRCVFLTNLQRMYLPVAHAEGKFVVRDDATLATLRENEQIALTYANRPDRVGKSVGYPANPNGSVAEIAGVCDETGRVFGLMPHPERFVHRTQHPRWTREDLPEAGDGLQIFRNVVNHFTARHAHAGSACDLSRRSL